MKYVILSVRNSEDLNRFLRKPQPAGPFARVVVLSDLDLTRLSELREWDDGHYNGDSIWIAGTGYAVTTEEEWEHVGPDEPYWIELEETK